MVPKVNSEKDKGKTECTCVYMFRVTGGRPRYSRREKPVGKDSVPESRN